jgi:hypothetical protein
MTALEISTVITRLRVREYGMRVLRPSMLVILVHPTQKLEFWVTRASGRYADTYHLSGKIPCGLYAGRFKIGSRQFLTRLWCFKDAKPTKIGFVTRARGGSRCSTGHRPIIDVHGCRNNKFLAAGIAFASGTSETPLLITSCPCPCPCPPCPWPPCHCRPCPGTRTCP